MDEEPKHQKQNNKTQETPKQQTDVNASNAATASISTHHTSIEETEELPAPLSLQSLLSQLLLTSELS